MSKVKKFWSDHEKNHINFTKILMKKKVISSTVNTAVNRGKTDTLSEY